MTVLLNSIQFIFNNVMGMVSTVVSTITAEGNELILFFVLVGFAGMAITITRRLMGL